jgi:hypothetical protein
MVGWEAKGARQKEGRSQPFDSSTHSTSLRARSQESRKECWLEDRISKCDSRSHIEKLVLIGLLKLFEELGGRDDL